MVFCSIEEAWGTNFDNLQQENNRYKYDFSRDSKTLKEHNGTNREATKQNVVIKKIDNYDADSEELFETFKKEEEEPFENKTPSNNNEKKENEEDDEDEFEGEEEYYEDEYETSGEHSDIILDKLNAIMNMINKNDNGGFKDIIIFVIVGIFIIFVMDLIFRIGQKITK